MSSEVENRYLKLADRYQASLRIHAVLLAREEEKKTRRDEIISELQAVGIDPTDVEGEIKRLEAEIERDLSAAEAEIDAFEKSLQHSGQSTPTVMEEAPPKMGSKADDLPVTNHDSDDIQI